MLKNNRLIWLWVLLTALTANAWAVTDTIQYTYDSSLQVIKTQYNSAALLNYIYDGAGNRLSLTTTANSGTNHPPNTPSNPAPAISAIDITSTTALSWTGTDPDPGDSLVFDVYLGTSSNPPIYQKGVQTPSFQPGQLLPLTTYYWKIRARDTFNAETDSPVWSFTTKNEPPTIPNIIDPYQSGTIVPDDVDLNWESHDPDLGDTVTFDVYFGTSSNPPLVKSNSTVPTYKAGALSANTTYYWKVTAKDNHGATTTGPVWTFTTTNSSNPVKDKTISTNTTLTATGGPYTFTGTLTIPVGVTLTIQPGTVIKMGLGSSISVNGTLIAVGQSSNPIIITSINDDANGGDTSTSGFQNSAQPGDWLGIRFNNSSDASQLSYVKILYAGNPPDSTGGSLYCYNGNTKITNCEISYSASDGIYIQKGTQTIAYNVFNKNTRYDINVYYCGTGCDSFTGAITGNIIRSGVNYISNTTWTLTGNTFDGSHGTVARLHPDKIGKLQTDNSFTNITAKSRIETVTGTISHDATWSSIMPYHIMGNVTVQGTDGTDNVTTLTIQPGAKLYFDQSSLITVGSSNVPGALIANGTANSPILFTSSSSGPLPGAWSGISFNAPNNLSSLEYCKIFYAYNGITLTSASPLISFCTISYVQNDGIYINSGSPAITDSIINNCGRYGVNVLSATGISIIGNVLESNGNYDLFVKNATNATITDNIVYDGLYLTNATVSGFTGNSIVYNDAFPVQINPDDVSKLFSLNTVINLSQNSILNLNGGTISHNATWTSTVGYHVTSTITVQGTDGANGVTTLTIQPGTRLYFDSGGQLTIGGGNTGALAANGTSSTPILFTSSKSTPAPGDWGGIIFNPNTAAASLNSLSYCTISYAGSITIYNGSPAISNCTISYASLDGIYVYAGSPGITNCNIHHCGKYGVETYSASSMTLSGNVMNGNTNYDFYLNNAANTTITGNALNSGLYINGGSTTALNNNTITYKDSLPVRVNADDVSKLLTSNTLSNISTNSYLEVAGGTMSHNATWTTLMPYHIISSITIQGTDGANNITTLTLQPGVRLYFSRNTSLTIGANSGAPGALVANGTSSNPIQFTSLNTTPAAGDWYGINFNDTASDAVCVMNYCNVAYAGFQYGYGIYIYYSSPKITNCTISYSLGDGIYVYQGSPLISNCFIHHCGRYGINATSTTGMQLTNNTLANNSNFDIYLGNSTNTTLTGNSITDGIFATGSTFTALSGNTITYNDSRPVRVGPDDVGKFLSGNTLSNLTQNSMLEVTSGTMSHNATWTTQMPYHITGSITVQGTDGSNGVTTLTIQPGAKLYFDSGCQLSIGGGSTGALVANGTSATPILFTSSKSTPAAGDWNGIMINVSGAASTLSSLKYCTISYAGSGNYCANIYTIACSPIISNCTISYSQADGIYSNQGSPSVTSCNIHHCTRYGINAYSVKPPTVTSNTFSSNTGYDLYMNYCTNATITGNTINSGLFMNGCTTTNLSGNTITYKDSLPVRVAPDDVRLILNSNTINNITTNSFLEISAGTLSHTTTWTTLMPYHVTGSITVQGTDGNTSVTTLTLQPGVRMYFDASTGINVGAQYVGSPMPGALIAIGTTSNPILFTSAKGTPAPGDWIGISFCVTSAASTLSTLEYCTISYAGASNGTSTAVNIYNCSPLITYCTISNSLGDGIYINQGSPAITDCKIINCKRYGINASSATSPSIIGNVMTGNGNADLCLTNGTNMTITDNTIQDGLYMSGGSASSFSNNTITYNSGRPMRVNANDVARLFSSNTLTNTTTSSIIDISGSTLSLNATWNANVQYHITGTVTVQGTDGTNKVTTLTIQPGTIIYFDTGSQLAIGACPGYTSAPGALIANGTSTNPIYFTSSKSSPAAGDWNGICFNVTSAAQTLSSMVYCSVSYAGYSTTGYAVNIYNSSPTIANCTIGYDQGDGIYINTGTPSITGSSIHHCGRTGINANNATTLTVTGNTFTGNSNYDACIYNSTNVKFKNNTVTNGFLMTGGASLDLTGNTITYSDTRPVRLNPDDVAVFMNGNTFSNITTNSFAEVAAGTISHDATWPLKMPYHIIGNILIQGTDGSDGVTTLTLPPGSKLYFSPYIQLAVGNYSGAPGSLMASGTAQNPILFTSVSASPAVGDWGGILFYTTASSMLSALDYCTVSYAGYGGTGGIYIYGTSPAIDSCTITKNNYGIYVYSGTPAITNNRIYGNSNYGMYKASSPAVAADHNWWGDASGPYNPTFNPNGKGDRVTDYVSFTPWLTQ